MSSFFERTHHAKAGPTEAQVERDVRALMHGTKEGKVVVENTKPKTVSGVRHIVDETGGNHSESETKTE
jgi:hypothetical protein